MNAESLAQKKASQKAKKYAGNVKKSILPPINKGLVTIDKFWSDYETGFVTISRGKLEIQSLDPGEFLIVLGTTFVKMLNDKGIDITDSESVTNAINDSSIEIYDQHIRRVICQGVISIKFVDKVPQECDPEKEVSVYRLSQDDQFIIYNAIKEISIPEEVAEKATSFPDESGNSSREGGTDADIPDSTNLSPTSITDIVSTNS